MTVSELVKRLTKYWWSKVTFVALLLFFAYPVYQSWAKERAVKVAEQERKAAMDRVGTDASIAGSMLWGAYKACARIGIPDIAKCAKYEGVLLQEKAAPVLAQLAVDQRASYDSSCQKVYATEYCYNLLNRAFQLSRTAPESRQE